MVAIILLPIISVVATHYPKRIVLGICGIIAELVLYLTQTPLNRSAS